MEMCNRLSTMIIKKPSLYYLLVLLVCFVGCNQNQPSKATCGINGTVTTYDEKPQGFKITLISIADNNVQYVAVADANGRFVFRDLDAGRYTIKAEKQGYDWVWLNDDGHISNYNREIELKDGQIKEIAILMKKTSSSYDTYELEFTDMYGKPIGTSINVPKYAATISFKLFNGTDSNHSWSVMHTKDCFVSDDMGVYSEYVFDDFYPTSGTLKPGDNIVMVGKINPDIWSIYDNSPYYVYSTLIFYIGETREVTLNIDFN